MRRLFILILLWAVVEIDCKYTYEPSDHVHVQFFQNLMQREVYQPRQYKLCMKNLHVQTAAIIMSVNKAARKCGKSYQRLFQTVNLMQDYELISRKVLSIFIPNADSKLLRGTLHYLVSKRSMGHSLVHAVYKHINDFSDKAIYLLTEFLERNKLFFTAGGLHLLGTIVKQGEEKLLLFLHNVHRAEHDNVLLHMLWRGHIPSTFFGPGAGKTTKLSESEFECIYGIYRKQYPALQKVMFEQKSCAIYGEWPSVISKEESSQKFQC